MSAVEKECVKNNANGADSSAPLERNAEMVEYKEKMGLPKWKDLSAELEELAKRHDTSWANQLQAKVELHRKYVEYQTLLAQNFSSMGLQHINALNNTLDLQNKLFELEEKLRGEGINPLEDEKWMKSREMLAKEIQFLHKHKLDIAQFQQNLQGVKKRQGDDAMFVVDVDAS